MQKTEWGGIRGETKEKIYDENNGKQILSNCTKLLCGKDNADYEVDGACLEKNFAAMKQNLGGILPRMVSPEGPNVPRIEVSTTSCERPMMEHGKEEELSASCKNMQIIK